MNHTKLLQLVNGRAILPSDISSLIVEHHSSPSIELARQPCTLKIFEKMRLNY